MPLQGTSPAIYVPAGGVSSAARVYWTGSKLLNAAMQKLSTWSISPTTDYDDGPYIVMDGFKAIKAGHYRISHQWEYRYAGANNPTGIFQADWAQGTFVDNSARFGLINMLVQAAGGGTSVSVNYTPCTADLVKMTAGDTVLFEVGDHAITGNMYLEGLVLTFEYLG